MDEPLLSGLSPGSDQAALHASAMTRAAFTAHEPAPAEAARPDSSKAKVAAFDFAAVVTRHESNLLRYVGQIIPGATEADRQDVVQEAFLRLHRQVKDHGHASIQAMPAWLARVAHNLAVDLLKKKELDRAVGKEAARQIATGELPTQETVDQLGDMARREAADRALTEMQKLPAEQKQVLLLRLIHGLKLEEIAEITGLTTGNAAYRINQGLSELARRLKASGVI